MLQFFNFLLYSQLAGFALHLLTNDVESLAGILEDVLDLALMSLTF